MQRSLCCSSGWISPSRPSSSLNRHRPPAIFRALTWAPLEWFLWPGWGVWSLLQCRYNLNVPNPTDSSPSSVGSRRRYSSLCSQECRDCYCERLLCSRIMWERLLACLCPCLLTQGPLTNWPTVFLGSNPKKNYSQSTELPNTQGNKFTSAESLLYLYNARPIIIANPPTPPKANHQEAFSGILSFLFQSPARQNVWVALHP